MDAEPVARCACQDGALSCTARAICLHYGIKKDLRGADVTLPHKKPKKSREEKETQRLTEKQKSYNKRVGSIRVTIENSIGRIKQYARMTEPYGGTEDELNAELNVVAGLVNCT